MLTIEKIYVAVAMACFIGAASAILHFVAIAYN